jgi:hypothetical protein
VLITSLVVTLTLAGAPKVDEKLVGTWLAGQTPFVTFNANGTGTMEDGKVKWSADGRTLVVTDEEGSADTLGYTVAGGTLTLNMGGMPVVLTKAGAKAGPLSAKAQQLGQTAPVQQTQPRGAANDQLSQLLLSSAWCNFRYNKVSGTSSSSRYQYFRDGTWSTGGRTETYNSGANGTVSGQYDSSNRGHWEVRGGQLFMSMPENPVLQPVPFTIALNSNGSPIITANGLEYSMCN